MEENNKYCSRGQYFKVILNLAGRGGGILDRLREVCLATQPCLRQLSDFRILFLNNKKPNTNKRPNTLTDAHLGQHGFQNTAI